jgi:hypothetical protein
MFIRNITSTTLHGAISRLILLVPCVSYSSILKMEAVCSFETPVNLYHTTRRHIPAYLAGSLRGLHFDPEDGGSIFLRNVGKLLSCYTVPHSSSACCLNLTCPLLDLLFDPEDGSSMFVRNVGKLVPHGTAPWESSIQSVMYEFVYFLLLSLRLCYFS